MTILQEINAYLLTKITPYSEIQLDAFTGASDEVMVRNDPSQAVERRYMDGSRSGQFQFSYYAKSMVQETARQQLDAIVDALNLPSFTDISGTLSAQITVVTSPAFVSKSENLESIYTAGFRLDYIKGGA